MDVFPDITSMEWNNTKTPSFDVVVQKAGSKRRKTMVTHAYPEWELKCAFTALNHRQVDQIAGFFAKQYGGLKPFLWLDMEDYRQAGTLFGVGDGTTQRFQLLRTWGDGQFYEPVTDIMPGTLVVYAGENRVTVTLEDDGIVYFATPPAIGVKLAADFVYYWRVAFDESVTWEIIWYDLYKLNSFKLVSVR